MTRDEKVLYGLAVGAVALVILWQRKTPPTIETIMRDPVDEIGMSFTPGNEVLTRGPAYLQSNTPYAFAPPVNNFLPSVTAGQQGQTVNQPTDFAKSYKDGCIFC